MYANALSKALVFHIDLGVALEDETFEPLDVDPLVDHFGLCPNPLTLIGRKRMHFASERSAASSFLGLPSIWPPPATYAF
jgi:hypothetical protein